MQLECTEKEMIRMHEDAVIKEAAEILARRETDEGREAIRNFEAACWLIVYAQEVGAQEKCYD